MITLMLMLLATFSRADDFSQHTVSVEAMSCQPLNYDSYFVAQNSKANIKESNPQVAKPNFAGHYLILKNQLMMETVWMIADCRTGKFLKEKLSGTELEFKADSALVIMKSERKPSEYYLWQDENWNRVEMMPAAAGAVKSTDAKKGGSDSAASAAQAPTPTKKFESAAVVMQQSTVQQYQSLFDKNKSPVLSTECKPLDFNSYFKAQQAKENILRSKPDFTHANFAGRYLLIKNEVMFQNIWLIADCETGKFYPVSITGKAIFKNDSSLVVMQQSGDYGQLMAWSDLQWIELVDASRANHPSVRTSLSGDKAKAIYQALPNPNKMPKLKFENLNCQGETCTVDLPRSPQTKLNPESNRALTDLLSILGGSIEKGWCEQGSKFTSCEITIH